MFSIAKREGRLGVVPFIELQPAPPARKGFVKPDAFEKLLVALPAHLQPLITFLYYCGRRVREACEIQWSQIDLKAATVTFDPEQTKTSEARTVPPPDRLLTMLRAVRVKSEKVFDSTALRPSWYRACCAAGPGKMIQVEGKRDRYTDLNLHDLRRSALNNLRKVEVPPIVAMRFSGHTTMSTFLRYNIVDATEDCDAESREALGHGSQGRARASGPTRMLGVCWESPPSDSPSC